MFGIEVIFDFQSEERNVRAATRKEIITVLQSCTNCRDQLLILILAETGFRIGEVLGIDYTKDIDYQKSLILCRVWACPHFCLPDFSLVKIFHIQFSD